MDGGDIRRAFLKFFEERDHRVVPSSSLISPDPSLLLTTAGMVQFIPYFLGQEEPPYRRATSVQKSFRTVDIENVGHTDRHLTLFEMLGNFSFGDYFKKDAIRWAHELVTEVYGIDHERLWVTVFETDEEAVELWADEVNVPRDRIVRRGKADNFWWTHAAGPCGPCSEVYVDRGPRHGREGGPAVDEERYCEVWNLVFMQNECDDHGTVLRDLPMKNIDTGSSLERLAMVLQDADNVFLTDLLRPLLGVAEDLTGVAYGSDERADVSLRVMAEHGRATTFLMADGVLPANEGRGYVLRRMLRRLVTHARRLGVDKPVMDGLVQGTIDLMGAPYPELAANKAFILQVASSEEERFGATFSRGMALFEEEAVRAKESGAGVFSGEAAFRLHDTFGFPEELTLESAAEEGLAVDTDRFAALMDDQRRRAREARKKGDTADAVLGEVARVSGPSDFLGYEQLGAEARLIGMVRDGAVAEAAEEGQTILLVLDRTPFYPEGGGQIGDAGTVRSAGGLIRVTDTRPGPGGTIVHEGLVESGEVRQGDPVEAQVDAPRRESAARSHTATHVLHATLRGFLGEHARQAGSLVAPGRLRFDFTHYEAVPRHALEEIEYLANRHLADDEAVRAYETTFEFARSQGAIALFGEKYGDVVRVVEIGDYSIELCGGTHVRHTGEVALVRLVSEASIGSGFRRIEALTGPEAIKQVNVERRLLEEVVDAMGGGDPNLAPERVRQAVGRIKQLESELGKVRRARQQQEVEQWLRPDGPYGHDVEGVRLVVVPTENREADELREVALAVRNRQEQQASDAAFVIGSAGDGRALLVASCTKRLVDRGVTAPDLLREAAATIGGGAGGKPGLAFAGGSKPEALGRALAGIPARLGALVSGG